MYRLPKLNYPYDALEPFIDRETMKIHHQKHHQGYVDSLNRVLKDYPDFAQKEINDLLLEFKKIPQSAKKAVQNYGGGHANHTLFWTTLKKGVGFAGGIAEEIKRTFGGFEGFKKEFEKEALSLFGSGWVWLVLKEDDLKIKTTPNQDSPFIEKEIPVLGLDVWEHAYYLKYQNKRADYVDAFFKIINWEEVNKRFEKVIE